MTKTIPLQKYRSSIELDTPLNAEPTANVTEESRADYVLAALTFLLKQLNAKRKQSPVPVPESFGERRQLLQALLTIRDPDEVELNADVSTCIDRLLRLEAAQRDCIDSDTLPSVSTAFVDSELDVAERIVVWRGDITQLRVDAIVNAANEALLGCFNPRHRCIDNVIHAAAGPQLRDDCHTIMKLQRNKEPVGACKVTRAYALPSRYVLHTVGPYVDGKLKRSHCEALASCYTACLDEAVAVGARSVAFCCVSTGEFHFPNPCASVIAIAAVREWLQKHENAIDRVVFDVFLPQDELLYRRALLDAKHVNASLKQTIKRVLDGDVTALSDTDRVSLLAPDLERARECLRDADVIVVGAGAGMSAAAGLDYTDEELFAREYPAMKKYGLRCMYEFIGYRFDSDELQWGVYSKQVHLARFTWPQHTVYERLLHLVQRTSAYRVLTSNVDNMFVRNGFDERLVLTPQGDYGYLQCLTPCTQELVPFEPLLTEILKHTDPVTQVLTDSSLIPKCAHCGGKMFMNVRGGDWFVQPPHRRRALKEFNEFTTKLADEGKRVVVIEIGAGIVEENRKATLIRVNAAAADVPASLGARAIGLPMDASEFVNAVFDCRD